MILRLSKKIWPELNNLNERRQLMGSMEVLTVLYSLPLAIAGLVWLVTVTNLDIVREHWVSFIVFFALIIVFELISYFISFETNTYSYGGVESSFGGMVQWTAVLLLGPTALWMSVAWSVSEYARSLLRSKSQATSWSLTRNLILQISSITLAFLVALSVYQYLGGEFPIAGLKPQQILPAFIAIVIHLLLVILVYSGYLIYAISVQRTLSPDTPIRPLIRFAILGLTLPALANLFGILAAGLYVMDGWFTFAYFMFGLLMVAYLARQLSLAAENSRQQSRLMEILEQLGRAILGRSPGDQELVDILEEYVPQFLPSGRMAIWLVDTSQLIKSPAELEIDVDSIWAWVIGIKEAQAFQENEALPWATQPGKHRPTILAPIIDVEARVSIGFVYIETQYRFVTQRDKGLERLFPFVQALAAQVASALNQEIMLQDRLEFQRKSQELEFAGRIQSSFLPNDIPIPEGWEFAVTLLPARETYGDYFDFIPFPDGRIGILIADVTDKGLGAALYMALSRTLIRTFAQEYDDQPELVFFFANERLLEDARANLFVTAFYGILDPQTGELTYSNAGHNQQYIFNKANGSVKDILPPTGMPLGVEENTIWGQGNVQIEPGDVLILFTDGILDAQNQAGEFFEENRLVQVVTKSLGSSAQEVQSAVLTEIQAHMGNTHQYDDITLLILSRNF